MKKMNRQIRLLMRNGLKATITFCPRKVKRNIIKEMKNGRHMLGNTEKRLVMILLNQFQIFLALIKYVLIRLWTSLLGTIWHNLICDAGGRPQVYKEVASGSAFKLVHKLGVPEPIWKYSGTKLLESPYSLSCRKILTDEEKRNNLQELKEVPKLYKKPQVFSLVAATLQTMW